MKKCRFSHIALSLATLLIANSCQPSEEEKVREISQNFAELYYNLNIRKAKYYCTRDIHTIMDFRNANIQERDRKLREKVGKATVEILSCDVNVENEIAYVKIAINNILCANYMTDSIYIEPRDTIELVLTKEIDNVWRIKHPV